MRLNETQARRRVTGRPKVPTRLKSRMQSLLEMKRERESKSQMQSTAEMKENELTIFNGQDRKVINFRGNLNFVSELFQECFVSVEYCDINHTHKGSRSKALWGYHGYHSLIAQQFAPSISISIALFPSICSNDFVQVMKEHIFANLRPMR